MNLLQIEKSLMIAAALAAIASAIVTCSQAFKQSSMQPPSIVITQPCTK